MKEIHYFCVIISNSERSGLILKKKKNGLIYLVFFWILFSGVGFSLLPLLLVGYFIFNVLKKDNKKSTSSGLQHSRPLRRETSVSRRIRFNGKDTQLIDEKLSQYFKNNESLPLIETIGLKPEKGKYTNLKDLYVVMDNECIATLEDFSINYCELYNNIMKILLKFTQSEIEIVAEPAQNNVEEETTSVLTAEHYIERVNQLNTAIDNEEITNGLYQTSALLKHIAMIEQKFPDNRSKLNKLYQYYLPILIAILESYKDLNDTAQNHEEFKQTEDRLIKTIILINEAMKTISSSLCDEDFLNLSANISTLETLLKKDGLVKEGTLSMKARGEK